VTLPVQKHRTDDDQKTAGEARQRLVEQSLQDEETKDSLKRIAERDP